MKKLISILLCLVLCLSLFACITEEEKKTASTSKTQATEEKKTTSASTTRAPVNTESPSTEKDTVHTELDINSRDSFTKVPIVMENGKIIFDNDKVVGVSISSARITFHDGYTGKDNKITLEYGFSYILDAIKALEITNKPEDFRQSSSGLYYDVDIYLENGTRMGFFFDYASELLGVNGEEYFVEDYRQLQNLLAYTMWPYTTERYFPYLAVNIEEGHISFLDDITKLEISKYEYSETIRSVREVQTIEYYVSEERKAELVDIILEFENMDLLPVEITQPKKSSYTTFSFYSIFETAGDYYVTILHTEIDGVQYLKINRNYYAVEDSVIEELYSKLTFSIQ